MRRLKSFKVDNVIPHLKATKIPVKSPITAKKDVIKYKNLFFLKLDNIPYLISEILHKKAYDFINILYSLFLNNIRWKN
jgi:hypothetical protein